MEVLTSQSDATLRQSLRQQLEKILGTNEGEDLLRDIVEWILQESVELEFIDKTGAERYERS